MGRWGAGIWNSDGALDAVGEIERGVVADLERYARTRRGPRTPARIGAAVGVLVRLRAYDLQDPERAKPAIAAARKHEPGVRRALGGDAVALLGRVAAGEGASLVERKDDDAELRAALGVEPGLLEPALFSHPLAQAYLAKIVRRGARAVDASLGASAGEGGLDLHEDGFLGPLGVLVALEGALDGALEGAKVPSAKLARWREALEREASRLEGEGEEGDDPDRAFFKERLLPRVRQALARLEARRGEATPARP